MKWHRDEFTITDRREDLDEQFIHRSLCATYWAKDIPFAVMSRSLDHSLCLGIYCKGEQVGFGRAVSDRATFAYLTDIFVSDDWRGRGLAKWLVQCFREHPDLQNLRRWVLATKDAQALYLKTGFTPLSSPDWFMEVFNPAAYEKPAGRDCDEASS